MMGLFDHLDAVSGERERERERGRGRGRGRDGEREKAYRPLGREV
jgi:hypothetical protein